MHLSIINSIYEWSLIYTSQFKLENFYRFHESTLEQCNFLIISIERSTNKKQPKIIAWVHSIDAMLRLRDPLEIYDMNGENEKLEK